MEVNVLAAGLKFPEGPAVMADGSIAVCEIGGGMVTRVTTAGAVSLIAKVGGGPNGLAIGQDKALYVCNNGGNDYREENFLAVGPAIDYSGGFIQRIDMTTGHFRTIYTY